MAEPAKTGAALAATTAPSLARRLFLIALVWALALLTVTGIVLAAVNRTAVERGFDRRLGVYVKLLIADIASAVDDPQQQIGANLGEPLFELPQSGWYWQILRVDAGRREQRQSRSVFDGRLERLPDEVVADGPTRSREGYMEGPQGQRLRAVERTIDLGEDGEFIVMVAGDSNDIVEAVNQFNVTLVAALALLGLGMIAAAFFQVRVGLTPLGRIVGGLSAIRAGRNDHLEGSFPREIAPLAREVNALIDANREVVERARTHVGNLAHALKTPISVLQNEAEGRDDPLAAKVAEQTRIMRDQVNHHLERARRAARSQVAMEAVDVVAVVGALARTMEKIYRDKAVSVSVESGAATSFRGERQDLEEMVGNLVDNACKWAASKVVVRLDAEPAETAADRAYFTIAIDDDGPGLTEAERRSVGARGKRLDETKPGTGLGLSIVQELAGLYGGGLTLRESPRGGLGVDLRLPAV